MRVFGIGVLGISLSAVVNAAEEGTVNESDIASPQSIAVEGGDSDVAVDPVSADNAEDVLIDPTEYRSRSAMSRFQTV